MAANGMNTAATTAAAAVSAPRRRFSWLLSGIALRLLIAFIISWLVLLIFFATGVVSH